MATRSSTFRTDRRLTIVAGASPMTVIAMAMQVAARPAGSSTLPVAHGQRTGAYLANADGTPGPGVCCLPIDYANQLPATPTPAPTRATSIVDLPPVDVVLVIDTSSSMGKSTPERGISKLQAAVDAMSLLVQQLKPLGQSAVVSFDSAANIVLPLTRPSDSVLSALRSLQSTSEPGTRLDLALQVALEAILSPGHLTDHRPAIVLVTAGHHAGPGGNDEALSQAERSRAERIELVTVGWGTDVDEALLRQIATTPQEYFREPGPEILPRVCDALVGRIPSP
jgi:uncharacterized protein YegL